MNAERLLAHFERISEAPDAIARLRRFILDLAVRGKLVEQDPEDEPAENALRIVRLQKQIIQVEGRIRKDRNTPVLVGNPPFALPDGWQWLPFGEIHWLVRGVTYTKTDISDAAQAGYVPVLRAGNIGPSLTLDDPVFVRSDCISTDQYLQEGDFLIALSSGSKSLVGKAALVGDVDAYAFGGFCGVIRLVDKEYNDFTGVYLQSDLYREAISLGSRGIGINNLKKEVLANSYFPLPPLAEQHRIVAKVDELMALCDQLEAARQQRQQSRDRLIAATLQRLNQPAEDPASYRQDASFALQVLPSLTTTPAQIKQLRQTILNLAVRGKLVEQDPEDEPAEELVRLIADDKKLRMAERRIRAPRNAHSVNSEDVPLDLPPSWKTFPLGDISLVSDPNPSHRYPSYDGGTVPILSTQEFSGLDGWNPSTAKLVQREFHDYQVDSCNFEPGDIVFARKGRIGLPRFLPSLERYAFSHTVFIVKPLCGVYPQYLLWALRRQAVVDWLTKEMNQNTGVPTLGKDKTERLPIPLPPLSEQHRIVAKVDELMALCDQLEQQLNQADQQRRRLLEALLAEALGGRLPTEEESHATVA
jgi:type I restriction enzyme S subunit